MQELAPSIIQLFTALAALTTALIAWRTKKQVNVLEKNTNSIKDALVVSTAKENFAAGLKQGQNEIR